MASSLVNATIYHRFSCYSPLDWLRGPQKKEPHTRPISSLGEEIRGAAFANVAEMFAKFIKVDNLTNVSRLVGGGGEI